MSFLEEYHAKLIEPTHWTCRSCNRRRPVYDMIFNGYCRSCTRRRPKLLNLEVSWEWSQRIDVWTSGDTEIIQRLSKEEALLRDVVAMFPDRTVQAIRHITRELCLPPFKTIRIPHNKGKGVAGFWNEDRRKKLYQLRWKQKYSMQQVADEMRCTRNAVISAAHRYFHRDGTEKKTWEPRR